MITKVPYSRFEFIHKQIKDEIQKDFNDVYNENWFICGKKLNSFEEREKEYKTLLTNNPPTKIDFSDKIDEPIKNIDNLVKKTQQIRQEVFNSIEPPKQTSTIDIALLIKKQNEILIKILETQQKIIENIKK